MTFLKFLKVLFPQPKLQKRYLIALVILISSLLSMSMKSNTCSFNHSSHNFIIQAEEDPWKALDYSEE